MELYIVVGISMLILTIAYMLGEYLAAKQKTYASRLCEEDKNARLSNKASDYVKFGMILSRELCKPEQKFSEKDIKEAIASAILLHLKTEDNSAVSEAVGRAFSQF